MDTKIWTITDVEEDYQIIQNAASLIREGQLVAFPTETVYGLGGNALDATAVAGIYRAKGRPGDNPLIVHIAEYEEIEQLVLQVPPKVRSLMETFWPGPLTLILKKSPVVPDETTAGLDSVAVRMPRHPVALALIRESGVPIAAPSANRSGRPSPTQAWHVMDDLKGRIPVILDGGSCDVGLESTVLDVRGEVPIILRPGGITQEMLAKKVGWVKVDRAVLQPLVKGIRVSSPGMKYTHYAPRAPVVIIKGEMDRIVDKIQCMVREEMRQGKRVGVLATQETFDCYYQGQVLCLGSRRKPSDLASNLFALLREFDKLGVDIILAEWIEEKNEGLAVMNRMVRASGFHIIEV